MKVINRTSILFIAIVILTILFFILDLALGSVSIPLDGVVSALLGKPEKASWQYIILNFRMPKAIAAILTGAGISVAGLQMQTLFRNPLADTSILGIGHGASLGVAIFVLASALFPGILPVDAQYNNWGIILAAVTGAFLVLFCISTVSVWLNDMVSLLIVGVMFGFVTGSLVSILQYFSAPELIKSYLIWTFGSLSGVTWSQLKVMAPIVCCGLALSFLFPKSMNAILLSEQYARSVGVRVSFVRNGLILITAILAGTLTAFTGPIAFIGIAVPHFVRLLFRTADHLILIPASILCGALLMLFCDMVSQLPGGDTILPINSVTCIIGAPVVVFIVIQNRRQKSAFS